MLDLVYLRYLSIFSGGPLLTVHSTCVRIHDEDLLSKCSVITWLFELGCYAPFIDFLYLYNGNTGISYPPQKVG